MPGQFCQSYTMHTFFPAFFWLSTSSNWEGFWTGRRNLIQSSSKGLGENDAMGYPTLCCGKWWPSNSHGKTGKKHGKTWKNHEKTIYFETNRSVTATSEICVVWPVLASPLGITAANCWYTHAGANLLSNLPTLQLTKKRLFLFIVMPPRRRMADSFLTWGIMFESVSLHHPVWKAKISEEP